MDNTNEIKLTTEDLAIRFQCSKQTIRRYVKAGMPVIRIGGMWRFNYQEVRTWLEENNKKSR